MQRLVVRTASCIKSILERLLLMHPVHSKAQKDTSAKSGQAGKLATGNLLAGALRITIAGGFCACCSAQCCC